jgi:NAD-dependent dihydropyrimidine dehydrogenase PreA subunit
MTRHRYIDGVVTLDLNRDACIGCGICTQVCPHAVFRIEEKKAQLTDRDACMECGACARNCPVGAIAVRTGVGCAYAVIVGALTGTEPRCDCAESSQGSQGAQGADCC